MACVQARTGDGESAYHHLEVFEEAFTMRNGFHSNNDTTRTGFSNPGSGPFTLEGNFIAMQAVHEMLLQSWSPTPGIPRSGVIRLFPAMPWIWHEASFTDLRAEGGYKVSAKRENNATSWFKIEASRPGTLRLRDNFDSRPPRWNRPGVKKVGDNYEVHLDRGETLEASLDHPAALPPKPPDAAEPLVIRRTTGLPRNELTLRIGADPQGRNLFRGDLARAVVIGNRALTAKELERLADPKNDDWAAIEDVTVVLDGNGEVDVGGTVQILDADGGLTGKMYHLDGKGWLEIPHEDALNGEDGLTLAVLMRMNVEAPPSGMRLFDKLTPGLDNGYLFDTYPGDSLRGPGVGHAAKLPVGKWVHVALTVDGKTGARVIHVNGTAVR